MNAIVTQILPAQRFAEGMDIIRKSREAIKVVLRWPDASSDATRPA